MSVRVLFLGPLADSAGTDELMAEAPLDWNGLLSLLDPETAAVLREDRVNVACAGRVLADKTALTAHDGDAPLQMICNFTRYLSPAWGNYHNRFSLAKPHKHQIKKMSRYIKVNLVF